MDSVTLKISWKDLFPKDVSDGIRRERWREWQKLAIKKGDREMVDYWNDCGEACFGCEYNDNSWCVLQSLPCTVNPILTFNHNMIGMACMGVGYKNKQLKFDL